MSDATIIVQHLASVSVFCCSFALIFTNRVSPVIVVGWATLCSITAWFIWDYWMGEELARPSSQAPELIRSQAETSLPSPSRFEQRLKTAKSAALIYAALLGLSPILKSLTRSTTSDSIWALSTWLLLINVAFFDYGSSSNAR